MRPTPNRTQPPGRPEPNRGRFHRPRVGRATRYSPVPFVFLSYSCDFLRACTDHAANTPEHAAQKRPTRGTAGTPGPDALAICFFTSDLIIHRPTTITTTTVAATGYRMEGGYEVLSHLSFLLSVSSPPEQRTNDGDTNDAPGTSVPDGAPSPTMTQQCPPRRTSADCSA